MAFCTNCGNDISAGGRFCDRCGQPITGAQPAYTPPSGAVAVATPQYQDQGQQQYYQQPPRPAPSGAVNANLMPSVMQIERIIRERSYNDVPLLNWWLCFLLLVPLTFGIYGIFLYFKRINRIDNFLKRKRNYYQAVVEYTERYAMEANMHGFVAPQLGDLKHQLMMAYTKTREINALLSLVLTICTLGIWSYVVMYKMNKAWDEFQRIELDFDERISMIWKQMNLLKYPLTFTLDPNKQRGFWVYLLLSIVTFGIWGMVWDYKMHNDPDDMFPRFHAAEDTVLQIVRT